MDWPVLQDYPEDAQYVLDHTDADGVQLGSSIERLVMERPLQEWTEQFKAVRRRTGRA